MINSLLTDMLNYGEVKFKTEKAARVYFKAMSLGKFKLAYRIEQKHSKPKQYDRTLSFELMLMAAKIKRCQ